VREFLDRHDAGRRLGAVLASMHLKDVVVLGLPRGGVVVATEVAAFLGAPLDVLVVRKLGLPSFPEVAMGAIAEGGIRYIDDDLVKRCEVSPSLLESVESAEWRLLEARERALRRGRRRLALAGRCVVIIDDGLATGATARVACETAHDLGAREVVLAVPVASADTISSIPDADRVVTLLAPPRFRAVGEHYAHFDEVSDAQVIAILDEAASRPVGSHTKAGRQ